MLIVFCGPSAVGKTTIMHSLCKKHGWNFIRVATTRKVRIGEIEKFQVSSEDFSSMLSNGIFWHSNTLFGNNYGTILDDIKISISSKKIYMLDWPISELNKICDLANLVFVVLPESEDQLVDQATSCGRGDRIKIIIDDYLSNYSNEAIDFLNEKLGCRILKITNRRSINMEDAGNDLCQYILTETSLLSTKWTL